jgi:electron transfer flavoprotein alpha/beta subunit
MSSILVYALHYDGAFNKNSLGAVSEGARLAGELGSQCDVVVVGDKAGLPDDLCASLGRYGAAKVYRVEGPEGLAQPVVDAMAKVISENGHGYALAKALESESPDLVLLGQQSDDGECYTIGAVVADHLRMPSLTQVIKIDVEDGALRCERQAEYGYDTVEVETPAVISVGDAINEPRYPSLKAIMGAKKKPLDTKGIGDADIDASRVGEEGSKVSCGDFKAPPQKEGGQIIEDEDTNETVEKVVAWLDERKLIGCPAS